MVGTGLAIAMALGAIGSSTATNMYGQHSANKTNQKALDTQAAADARNAELERQHEADAAAEAKAARETQASQAAADLAEKQREYNQRVDLDKQHWSDYVTANTPTWKAGANVLSNLYGLAGMTGAPSGPGIPSADVPPPPGMATTSGASMAPPSQPTSLTQLMSANQPATARRAMPMVSANAPSGGFNLSQLMELANAVGKPFGSSPVPAGT